jgi:protein-S-isoprenylcysteine O-methyltransferase Ste14
MPYDLSQLLAFVWSGWIATWPTQLLALIWLAWLVSWVLGALWTGRTQKQVGTSASQPYRIPIVLGGLLLTPWVAQAFGIEPLWSLGNGGTYMLAGVTVAGTLFTWWARLHLGLMWSHAVTRKEGHQIVDTGPYGLVRHPIYTGLIAAILATGIAVATPTAVLGALLIAFGLFQKARIEERFLAAELGADVYETYCRRVPMLVPFLRSAG